VLWGRFVTAVLLAYFIHLNSSKAVVRLDYQIYWLHPPPVTTTGTTRGCQKTRWSNCIFDLASNPRSVEPELS